MSTETTKPVIPWASKVQHQAIADACYNADIKPEVYLEDLKQDTDYIENGRRIHGKTVCSMFYAKAMAKATKDRISSIKAKQAEANKEEAE